MNINSYGYGNFYSDHRISNIPKADVSQTAKEQVKDDVDKKALQSNVTAEEPEQARVNVSIADPSQISITFNKNEDFGYIGRDSDITSLDMEKAISDMQQDSLFKEYQYFVGTANNVFASEDGRVLSK
ncbi:MAG: hypothetical protein K5662_08925 [Lachnospiraceae bacterium]|jgi:hypothetical protein|nr:hypothetical protein [Lachnospiraceae bacterium]